MKIMTASFLTRAWLLFHLVIFSSSVGLANQLVLEPVRDNTIWEDPSGSLSNGSGVAFFAGVTGRNLITRGLLVFDLSSIPAGSTITGATLELTQSNTSNNSSSTQSLTLQRLLKDWGEGSSNAGSGEGGGAPAAPGDATWIHTFFNTGLWDAAGGDFSSQISATTQVAGNGKYTWGQSAQLLADVQAWVDDPSGNFGWILRGNESTSRTAKRFDSRHSGNASNRPHLTVEFDPPAPQLTEQLFFAQFADGLGLSSELTVLNLSASETVTGRVDLSDDSGNPLSVDLDGEVAMGERSFSIPAGGALVLGTDGQGDLQTGGATVSSDRPLAGVILFSGPGLGVAGVGSSTPLASFLAPMEMNAASGVKTGVAVLNLDSEAKTLTAELFDLDGNLVASGTFGPSGASQPLAANGHLASFLDDPEFGFIQPPDLSDFRGVLKVTVSSGQVAATVIRQSPGEFATLPVSPPQ